MLRGKLETTPLNPTITIMGLSIDTTSIADDGFGGDGVSNRTSFFNTIKQGDLVEITGSISGANILWDAIELDN